MDYEKLRIELLGELYKNINILQLPSKDWVVKGFIDTYKNIYTISIDTKVISKILELMLFPIILNFAESNNLTIELAKHQNHYPDISFIDNDKNAMFAMDVKSTYRINDKKVNGFTLGAFTGYFRNRESNKNITFSYNKYDKHYVLGIIYTKQENVIDERQIYTINDIEDILSVVSDFDFILQEKYKIANSRTGSGNTKNIGSITDIDKLKNGYGPFSKLGIDIFDDYWMYYLTKDMATDNKIPYTNLKEYVAYKQKVPSMELLKEIEEEEPINIED